MGFLSVDETWAQFHRAAKQPIVCSQYVFHFIALLTVKHTERHANLPAVIARLSDATIQIHGECTGRSECSC